MAASIRFIRPCTRLGHGTTARSQITRPAAGRLRSSGQIGRCDLATRAACGVARQRAVALGVDHLRGDLRERRVEMLVRFDHQDSAAASGRCRNWRTGRAHRLRAVRDQHGLDAAHADRRASPSGTMRRPKVWCALRTQRITSPRRRPAGRRSARSCRRSGTAASRLRRRRSEAAPRSGPRSARPPRPTPRAIRRCRKVVLSEARRRRHCRWYRRSRSGRPVLASAASIAPSTRVLRRCSRLAQRDQLAAELWSPACRHAAWRRR